MAKPAEKTHRRCTCGHVFMPRSLRHYKCPRCGCHYTELTSAPAKGELCSCFSCRYQRKEALT